MSRNTTAAVAGNDVSDGDCRVASWKGTWVEKMKGLGSRTDPGKNGGNKTRNSNINGAVGMSTGDPRPEYFGIHQAQADALEALLNHYPWIVYAGYSFWRKLLIRSLKGCERNGGPASLPQLEARPPKQTIQTHGGLGFVPPLHLGMEGRLGKFTTDKHLDDPSRGYMMRDRRTYEMSHFLPPIFLKQRCPLTVANLKSQGESVAVGGGAGGVRTMSQFLRGLFLADQVDIVISVLVDEMQLDLGQEEEKALPGSQWEYLNRNKMLWGTILHLTLAASPWSSSIPKRLLEKEGVAVDAKDNMEWTALHWAVQGRTEVAALLVEKGATVDAQNSDRWTPLHYAAQRGHVEAVALLLGVGAVLDSQTYTKETPLHWAAQRGHTDVMGLLLETVENGGRATVVVDAKDSNGWASLHWAAANGHTAAVVLLLEKGRAEVDVKNHWGETPLHLAAQQGHCDAATLLLEKGGATVDATSNFGKTPLHHAARFSRAAAAQLLLGSGAAVDAKDKDGRTPLHMIAYSRYTQRAEVILGLLFPPRRRKMRRMGKGEQKRRRGKDDEEKMRSIEGHMKTLLRSPLLNYENLHSLTKKLF